MTAQVSPGDIMDAAPVTLAIAAVTAGQRDELVARGFGEREATDLAAYLYRCMSSWLTRSMEIDLASRSRRLEREDAALAAEAETKAAVKRAELLAAVYAQAAATINNDDHNDDYEGESRG